MASIKIRNDKGIEITADVRKDFPAIFNTRRSVNVSEDYKLYRSDKVIDIMLENGMTLVEIGQERIGWSKKRHAHTQIHTMRFRDSRFGRKGFGVGDSFPEIVVMNSHDGRCVFRAMAGVFRLVCSNGMVVGNSSLGKVIRRHYGEANAFDRVAGILADMPKAVAQVSQVIERWDGMALSEREQMALAKQMLTRKLPCGGKRPDWLQPEQLLEHRRDADAPSKDGSRTLWNTFNVLQESLTNANVERIGGEGRRRAIRPIEGVVDNIGFNQTLWTAADEFAAKLAKKRGLPPLLIEEKKAA